jgi:hypothetical protein
MPNIEFDVPMEIIGPYLPGGLPINQLLPKVGGTAYYFMVRPGGYQIVPSKFRSVVDSISQADGVSMQAPYIDGLVATMTIEYWESQRGTVAALELACASTARLMDQMLLGVLNSLRHWTTDPNNDQRYIWTPTGAGSNRLLTNVLLTSWPTLALDPPSIQRTFSLGTPYPYAIDISQLSPTITGGGSAVLTNNGNTSFSPVMKVQGATTAFVVTNGLTGETVSYDGTRPGAVSIAGGHYAEIDFFQGSIFLDGSGADLIAGLDPVATDFFTLAPGAQTISITGADVVVLYNHAYV